MAGAPSPDEILYLGGTGCRVIVFKINLYNAEAYWPVDLHNYYETASRCLAYTVGDFTFWISLKTQSEIRTKSSDSAKD